MNPNIREHATNTAFGYFAEDHTDSDFFIEGLVQSIAGEAILTFVVLAEKQDAAGNPIRGSIRGREFFEAMWAHFAASGTAIDVIQGEWTTRPILSTVAFTTNLDAFNAAAASSQSLEDAALNGTPTGSYAKSIGYRSVEIPVKDPAAPPFETAIVRFRKPKGSTP